MLLKQQKNVFASDRGQLGVLSVDGSPSKSFAGRKEWDGFRGC